MAMDRQHFCFKSDIKSNIRFGDNNKYKNKSVSKGVVSPQRYWKRFRPKLVTAEGGKNQNPEGENPQVLWSPECRVMAFG